MAASRQLTRPKLRLERTLGPLVVDWIETNLVHGPGDVQGQPIQLDDEQVRFIFRAYELDDRGRRLVRRGVFSRPKGRAKSELAAMIVCAEALGPVRFAGWDHDGRPLGRPVQAPYVPCIATEEGQAGNVYDALVVMLREGAAAEIPGLDVGLTRTFTPGGGKIAAVTAKAGSKDGGKETFAVFDETHLFVTPELHKLHATVRRNLAKRRAAEPWSLEVSTMYAPEEGSVAEHSHSYATAVADGKVTDPGLLFDHREGPREFDFDDDDQLRAALAEAYGEAAEWMDLDRLVAEARDPQTRHADFRRYFLNQATADEDDVYINLDAWDACAVEATALELMAEGRTACIGADGSRTHDTSVVGWGGRAEDGRVDVDCTIFSVRADAPHHVFHAGGRIDYDDVEEHIVDRFGLYRVEEAAYDPRYLERSADILTSRLPEAAIAPVEPGSRLMRDALGAFHRGVIEGIVRHRGDPAIRAHIAACKGTLDERGWVVRKRKHSKPIDAVIAMALAYWRASLRVSADPWAATW